MPQHYSNPKRESDPYALSDVETFYIGKRDTAPDCPTCGEEDGQDSDHAEHVGWYYWFCFPGCLPDSDPMGPFATEAEALADARDGMEDDNE